MKVSPTIFGFLFSFMGVVFVFLAFRRFEDMGEWDFLSYLFVAVATYDFLTAFRFFRLGALIRKKNNK
ncbi:DUF4305 domain-containing protein [Shouchella shacheensis]|uniref:DUF4305 domain-containing protein n=1 Tax=Shouchella shacheensis TaxID=1649580 RepID=UPI000740325A|nr:DUF4305 domain-containing protein [Shouchella shacheensis]